MPKPLTTKQALRAYSRQQAAALCHRLRAKPRRKEPRGEQPVPALIGQLMAAAATWLETREPNTELEQRQREALAMVVDFLAVHPRDAAPAHEYFERFLRFLAGGNSLPRRTET